MESGDIDIEPLCGGLLREVPFTHVSGEVSGILQHFRNGEDLVSEDCGVGGWDEFAVLGLSSIRIADGVNAMTLGPLAGHGAGARGGAVGGGGIAMGETSTGFREFVEVG